MATEGEESFGRRLVTLRPTDALLLEDQAGKSERFQAMDDVLGRLLVTVCGGQRVAVVTRNGYSWGVELKLPKADLAALSSWYDFAEQEKRGAWYLPAVISLKPGLVNLPAHFQQQPRFATGLALDQRTRVAPAHSPAGMYLWAVVQPLFEQLMRPFLLRGPELGQKPRDEQIASWAAIDQFHAALGLHLENELAAMRYGSGWSTRSSAEQLSLKQALVIGLASEIDRAVAQRWRELSIQLLAAKYYARSAKRRPTQRQVLTAALQRTMAGWFRGDWLAFLDYIGEQPAPDEEITTALPEPHLYVSVQERAPAAAAVTGVPEVEVQRILASFLGQKTPVSPVDRRVGVMRRYWQTFDDLHTRQRPGMDSLWGLVEDAHSSLPNPAFPHTPWQYLRVLPADLLREIDDCWGGVCIPQFNDRIVSATHPHKGLADAFGPALEFWHGVGLTAWFICEGPYSRTDLAGLPAYYQRCTNALAEAGFPIHESLFVELRAAESRLGKPEQIMEEISRSTTSDAPVTFTITSSVSRGTRRKGFEILQEIITRHRRWWSQTYLDSYVRYQWESPLRAFADDYNREVARTGRAPSHRRLAALAAPIANAWFGGELSTVCSAIGITALPAQTRVKLMPDDRFAFVSRVFQELGGQPEQPDDSWKRQEMYEQNWEYRRLAGESLRYIQHEESTGVAPHNAEEFHVDRYRWPDGLEAGWAAYVRAINAARSAVSVAAAPAVSQAAASEGKGSTASDSRSNPPPSPPSEDLRDHEPQPYLWQRLRLGRKG